MRQTLVETLEHATAVEYPKGSVVICHDCLMPLYILTRGIGFGERAGRTVSAYRPVSERDLEVLAEGKDWPADKRRQHCQRIPELKTGDPALCPCCGNSFVRVTATTADEVIDRAYTFELVTIPPGAPVSDRQERAWVR